MAEGLAKPISQKGPPMVDFVVVDLTKVSCQRALQTVAVAGLTKLDYRKGLQRLVAADLTTVGYQTGPQMVVASESMTPYYQRVRQTLNAGSTLLRFQHSVPSKNAAVADSRLVGFQRDFFSASGSCTGHQTASRPPSEALS